MDLNRNTERLANNLATISNFVKNIGDEQARYKPNSKSWSVLEVINHLHDEEREDFRVRLKYILSGAGGEVPPIDPEGWVQAREYNKRDLAQSLQNFETERKKSLGWLAELINADWELAYEHPSGEFRLRAGDVLNAWVAHDFLHLRQLVELHYLHHKKIAHPYSVDYAGKW